MIRSQEPSFNTVSWSILQLHAAANIAASPIAINSREKIVYDDASNDPRFSSEAGQSEHKSVLCLPIISNRDQTLGAAYFASKFPFSKHIVTMLTLLCQQASISISNALYFRSVQAGTRENLKMIAAQRDSLEDARRSREDALKATKACGTNLMPFEHDTHALSLDQEQLPGLNEPWIENAFQVCLDRIREFWTNPYVQLFLWTTWPSVWDRTQSRAKWNSTNCQAILRATTQGNSIFVL